MGGDDADDTNTKNGKQMQWRRASTHLLLLLLVNTVQGNYYSNNNYNSNTNGKLTSSDSSSQGPPVCNRGYTAVRKPEGWRCMPDYAGLWRDSTEDEDRGGREEGDYGQAVTPTKATRTGWPNNNSREQQGSSSSSSENWPQQQNQRDHFGFGQTTSTRTRPGYPTPAASSRSSSSSSTSPSIQRKAFTLPDADQLSTADEDCLSKEQVMWPADRRCYQLLQRGPCVEGEWLVLKVKAKVRSAEDEVEVVCERRLCPCTPEEPKLCEVWHGEEQQEQCSGCRVALAAEQDGLCRGGEQLLLSPFGRGVCGCRLHPPHARWPKDGRCHRLYAVGPCPLNHTLQYGGSGGSSEDDANDLSLQCVPGVCQDGKVLYADGRCYAINSRGPCDEDSDFVLDDGDSSIGGIGGENRDPRCVPRTVVKRVFDMAPSSNLRSGGARDAIIGKMRFQQIDAGGEDCRGEDGGCLQRRSEKRDRWNNNSNGGRRNRRSDLAKDYLGFLRSFRRQQQQQQLL